MKRSVKRWSAKKVRGQIRAQVVEAMAEDQQSGGVDSGSPAQEAHRASVKLDEAERCPHCGGRHIRAVSVGSANGLTMRVYCNTCMASAIGSDRTTALEKWNRRCPDEAELKRQALETDFKDLEEELSEASLEARELERERHILLTEHRDLQAAIVEHAVSAARLSQFMRQREMRVDTVIERLEAMQEYNHGSSEEDLAVLRSQLKGVVRDLRIIAVSDKL